MTLERIAYYTHKVAQYSQLRRRWPHRYRRLITYKTALMERISMGGGE